MQRRPLIATDARRKARRTWPQDLPVSAARDGDHTARRRCRRWTSCTSRIARGFVYPAAVLDSSSRRVLPVGGSVRSLWKRHSASRALEDVFVSSQQAWTSSIPIRVRSSTHAGIHGWCSINDDRFISYMDGEGRLSGTTCSFKMEPGCGRSIKYRGGLSGGLTIASARPCSDRPLPGILQRTPTAFEP